MHCQVQFGAIFLTLACPDKPLVEGLAQGDVGQEGQGNTGSLVLFHRLLPLPPALQYMGDELVDWLNG